MLHKVSGEDLWSIKYRPKTISECILPEDLKDKFKAVVDTKIIPTMLLSGTCGIGKTTVAMAMCNEVGVDCLYLNGSLEGRHIDTLRTTIQDFASTISLSPSKKVVILDESDGMPGIVQDGLKAFIEMFSSNCSFIFICNNKNKMIDPLQSRGSGWDFNITGKDRQAMLVAFFKRVNTILQEENIEFDKKIVAEVIKKYFPDFRRVINELQVYCASGTLDKRILIDSSEETFKELFGYLKNKNFTDMRKWVASNSHIDGNVLIRKIFDMTNSILDKPSIPQIVLILNDYQDKLTRVNDPEINTVACMTEIMATCKFI